MSKYSPEVLEFIRLSYPEASAALIAKRLNLRIQQVEGQIHLMGLKKKLPPANSL